jgi:hypothetical protein
MDSSATVTEWAPPRRFCYEETDWLPNAPTLASEWIVEARSGGVCVVRVVHSLFADGDEWDDQLAGFESGWPDFFRILRLYLTHFTGEHGVPIQLVHLSEAPVTEVWRAATRSLGLEGAAEGEERAAGDGTPPLAGRVEPAGGGEQILLRLDRPAPGLAHVFAVAMPGQTYLGVRLYLYGSEAPAVAARDEPRWQAWLAETLPPG